MIEIQISDEPAKIGFQQIGKFSIRVSVTEDTKIFKVGDSVVLINQQLSKVEDVVLSELAARSYRFDTQSDDWVGKMVCQEAELDADNPVHRRAAKNFILDLVVSGKIEVYKKWNKAQRKTRSYVREKSKVISDLFD